VRFSTLLLAAVIGLGGLTAVEAKPKTHPYGQTGRRNRKAKKFKVKKYKPGKYKAPKQKNARRRR